LSNRGGGDILRVMAAKSLTLRGFQKHIAGRYAKIDRRRGTPETFLWFVEEIGELATALASDDEANLREEFADVLAWLCTLANINDVDLERAVREKYLAKSRPKGHK
jgi:NTP pyrophosphatase (non-canonical NTP hydrolase)